MGRRHGLRSCFGGPIDAKMNTTCSARTFLQPQMNKANAAATRTSGGDVNPKDHIIYRAVNVSAGPTTQLIGSPSRDNTGTRCFMPDKTFPTLNFPSDHAIVSAEFEFGEHVEAHHSTGFVSESCGCNDIK